YSGESALLEGLYARGMAQPEVGKDLRAGDGLLFFWSHEPVAPWQGPAGIEERRRSLRPNQLARMIGNRWVEVQDGFFDLGWWDGWVDRDGRMSLGGSSLPVWVGIDASVKHDSTAVVACAYDRRARAVRLAWHRIFQPSAEEPIDFEATVEATLLDLK